MDGYAPFGANPFEPPKKKRQEQASELPPEVFESALATLASRSGNMLENIGLVLDTPGALARGVLAGDPLSGFNWNFDDRVSGKELLDAYGLKPSDKALGGSGAGLAGFATEVATDPLFLFQMGAGAVSKAGRAAQAAGILKNAPKAAMSKLGTADDLPSAIQAARSTMTGRSALKRLEDARVPVTAENLEIMPVVGDRLARYRSTLRDVVESTPIEKRPEVLRQLRDNLGSDEAVQELMDERLGNLFGFGFGRSSVTFSPFGEATTEKALDALDYLGQAARWNPATRYAASFVQKPLDGAISVNDQIDALRAYKEIGEKGLEAGRLEATKLAQAYRGVELTDEAKRILGADSLSSKEGNDLLLRFSNGKPTANDLAVLAETPELDAVLDTWDAYRVGALEDARATGLRLPEMQDQYGNRYNPRNPAELRHGEYGQGTGRRSKAATMSEMRQRNEALDMPGGEIDLREISVLPEIREHATKGLDSTLTDEQVGQRIMDWVVNKHGNPMITFEQATAAAKGFKIAAERAKGIADSTTKAIPRLEQQARDAATRVASLAARNAGNVPSPQLVAAMEDAKQAAEALRQAKQATPARVSEMASVPFPSPEQTLEVGRVMRKIDPTVPKEVPLYSEHPINAQMRYIVNTEVRKATQRHVLDSIAEVARPGVYTEQAGGPYRSLQEVLAKHSEALGWEAGNFGKPAEVIAEQMKARIAKRLGIAVRELDENGNMVENIDLSKFFVPESFSDRLVKISDFYNVPQAQEEVGNLFNMFTTLFKGFTLAWPSRFWRDAMSNLASIWLETGDAPGAVAGMFAASRILAGKQDKAIGYLAKIPRYARHTVNGVTDQAALLREFEQDVGRTGVLSGLATSDLLSASREGSINQFVPGGTPTSISQGIRQLIPTGERSVTQALGDFGTIRNVTSNWETRNPWLMAGQTIGDTVDSMARLGGFMAMLRKGIGPEEAARRVKSALVDYGSLTTWERHFARNIFMWWSYQSRIGKYAVQSLMENPGGRFAQMIRGVNDLQRPDEGGYVPTGLREQVAVRLPDFLQANEGLTTYAKNLDLPGLDVLNIPKVAPYGQMFPFSIQGTMEELFRQSNPITKTLAEIAFDKDLFSGRPLSENRTAVDRIYQGVTGDPTRVNPILKAALQNTPGLNRFISLGGTVFDPDIENPYYRALKVGINEASGFKFSDVDPEYQLLDARNAISEALQGKQNSFMVRSIPEESIPYLTPEELLLNSVDKELQQRLRAFYTRKQQERELQQSR